MKITLIIALLFTITIAFAKPRLSFTGFDLNPGKKGSFPNGFTPFGDFFIFSASQDSTSFEPWISDGTKEGTHMIKELNPGISSSDPHGFIMLKNKMYFSATDDVSEGLWQTDGTADGTKLIKRLSPATLKPHRFQPVRLGDYLLFEGDDGFSGVEAWISDGTTDGTHMLKDINPGPNGYPVNFITYNNKVLLNTCYNSAFNEEPWVTDGTIAGTQLLMDIFPGSQSSNISTFIPCNDKLYFAANDGTHGYELWTTDATTAGTHIVKDIVPGTIGSMDGIGLGGSTAYKDKLYFDARNGTHFLYTTDGTDIGTNVVAALRTTLGEGYSATFNDKLYMAATVADTGGFGIYYTNGTDSGTRQLLPPVSNNNTYSSPTHFTVYKNKLYFTFNNADSKLYTSDGTASGTDTVGPQGNKPFLLVQDATFFEYRDALWFCANFDSTNYELWRMAEIEDTTIAVTPFCIFPNPNNGNFTINTGDANFSGQATIYDAASRFVCQYPIRGSKAGIQIPAPASGVYFMRVISKDISTYKIVVDR